MRITNTKYDDSLFSNSDIFVSVVGYEERSYYLIDKCLSKLNVENTLCFLFDNYVEFDHTLKKVDEMKKKKILFDVVSYDKNKHVENEIIRKVKSRMKDEEAVTIHIDYSSMPRSWYCKLPMLLKNILRENDRLFFWYSEGEYPDSYEEYPSAGIESFSFYSGKPSLMIDNKRIHILALGFDAVRTEAITSIIDPDFLVNCYAYNPMREGFLENIEKLNHHQLSQASLSIGLDLSDFSFMISKLKETVNELLPLGDIILIPDGPKPLIFAMSIVPDLLDKQGVTCLHISRNKLLFEPIKVKPTGIVNGFMVSGY